MQYYAYIPREDGTEPMGTENRLIIKDLKTSRGALRRCLRAFGDKPFNLYTFTNFYSDATFTLIYRRDA